MLPQRPAAAARARRTALVLLALAAAPALAAGCRGGSASGGGGSGLPRTVGPGEGGLDLVAWPGSVPPAVLAPFERETGCRVRLTPAATSDEMVALMRSGEGRRYDAVSAPGDVAGRLVAGADVAQLNTDLITGFKDIAPPLQSPPQSTVDGKHYGIASQWGADLLMYDTTSVASRPGSWRVVFDGTSYAGEVAAYDSPISIAGAALYLEAARPDLGIADPYELTPRQLEAAVDLLQRQRPQIGAYWTTPGAEIRAFARGDAVIGEAWSVQLRALRARGRPVAAVLPREGATGWSLSWMMSAHARHPNCTYRWLAYATSPPAEAETARRFGSAPADTRACAILGPERCRRDHVGDQGYMKRLQFWKAPLRDCGDGGHGCTSWAAWRRRWARVTG